MKRSVAERHKKRSEKRRERKNGEIREKEYEVYVTERRVPAEVLLEASHCQAWYLLLQTDTPSEQEKEKMKIWLHVSRLATACKLQHTPTVPASYQKSTYIRLHIIHVATGRTSHVCTYDIQREKAGRASREDEDLRGRHEPIHRCLSVSAPLGEASFFLVLPIAVCTYL